MYYEFFFFFNDTATTEIYTLPLHDALPISPLGEGAAAATVYLDDDGSRERPVAPSRSGQRPPVLSSPPWSAATMTTSSRCRRSEEHTSELQSRQYLVCRLLLEKKKKITLIY